MKISTAIEFLIVLGGVLFVFALMINEGNTNYGENVNISEWNDKYDYASEINESIAPLQQTFDNIQDEDKGWFNKISSGIVAIPLAVTQIAKITFQNIFQAGYLVTGTFTTLKIPAQLIIITGILILVWAIFKLVEF